MSGVKKTELPPPQSVPPLSQATDSKQQPPPQPKPDALGEGTKKEATTDAKLKSEKTEAAKDSSSANANLAAASQAPKSAAHSMHHFDAPPPSGAPKDLEVLLHGKPQQPLIFGIQRNFFLWFVLFVLLFVVVYFFVGSGYTY
ncbi:MAG: hypothetical protein RLZZ488_958 [Pseudomonadota bacterium]|jgi:hypothetical protein